MAPLISKSCVTQSDDPTPLMGMLHPDSKQLGSGTITGELGEGGMAVVYEIWNEPLSVKRAVKVLKPHFSKENRDRFDTEMKLMAQLDHPNIVTIHSVGQWHGLPFIEMEKVDGWSLLRLVSQRGALPVDVTSAIGLIVARALHYTHSFEYTINGREQVGLLHRDLKPANILVSRRGKVRLTDFGIATPVNVSMHTPDGNVVGSLQYISPEQLEGKEIDTRADIYSFGCVLYEMITGFQVFPHTNITRLVSARIDNDYEPLTTFAPAIPARLRRLAERCLQIDPARRPASMNEICHELAKIYGSLSDRSPEHVIARYVTAETGKTRVMSPVGRHLDFGSPVRAIAAGALAAVVVGALAVSAGPSLSRWVRFALADSAGAPAQPEIDMVMNAKATDALIDSLRAAHRVHDLLAIMKVEDGRNNFANVLALSSRLSDRKAGSTLGVLLRTRALEGTGGLTEEYFRDCHINDAEFLLVKARWYYSQGRYAESRKILKAVRNAPAYLLSATALHREAMLDEARCLTAMARADRSAEVREEALASWRGIRYAYRKQTEDEAYKEAVRESFRLASL